MTSFSTPVARTDVSPTDRELVSILMGVLEDSEIFPCESIPLEILDSETSTCAPSIDFISANAVFSNFICSPDFVTSDKMAVLSNSIGTSAVLAVLIVWTLDTSDLVESEDDTDPTETVFPVPVLLISDVMVILDESIPESVPSEI